MNCTLNGVTVTSDDLRLLAIADGCNVARLDTMLAHLHAPALQRSHLLQVTNDVRFRLLTAGFLRVDTRPVLGPALPAPALDAEALAFFAAE